MILNGEAQCARQIVTVSNSEGKIIAYAKPQYPVVRIFLQARNILFGWVSLLVAYV